MRSCLTLAAAVLACAAARAAEPPPGPPPGAAQLLDSATARVSLDVHKAPLDDVLRILSKQFGLSIISARDVTTEVTARFKDVSLKEALDSLVTINGFSYRVKGRVIEVYVPRAGEAAAVVRPCVRTFQLKYANAEKLKVLLKSFLNKDTGRLEADIRGNTLIAYDMPDALENIATVIDRIDKPEPQVTIGAEIIEASINIDEKLGIDWQTRVAVTGASRPITFPFSKKNSHSNWVPSNDPGDDDDEDGVEFSPHDSFPYATAEDFTFGTLDATGLKIVLDILKTDSGTNLIANPEITTLNNREAKINIGDTVPVPIYTTNLETGVSAVTGFEEVETGTILVVTPQVNDHRFITLIVKPEISEILGYKGQYDERPLIASRKAETTVRLKDGETLVIGGLVSEKTEEVISKIPFLGDVPLLGWLFKSKHLQKQKSSLYIFVTPRILDGEAARNRAKLAARRLKRGGLRKTDKGGDDLRESGASPFQHSQ